MVNPWIDFANKNNFIILSPAFRFDQSDWEKRYSYQYPEVWSGEALLKMLEEKNRRLVMFNKIKLIFLVLMISITIKINNIYAVKYKLYAVNVSTGKTLWINEYDDNFCTSPVVVRDSILIGSANYKLCCFSIKDGKIKWEVTNG